LNILIIIGTRPEAIKLAPIVTELQTYNKDIKVSVCITAQHRELLDDVLENFKIIPDFDLDIMSTNQTLESITSNVLNGITKILKEQSYDWVIVQGDTTTALSSALAAFYQKVKVGHVEAGLRTYNKTEPFPEEINRQLISKLSDLHFAPTEESKSNLILENIDANDIVVTGNTVIDALSIAMKQPLTNFLQNILPLIGSGKKIITITAHRRENFGEPLENICTAIIKLASIYKDQYHFVYPVHPNPNVKTVVFDKLSGIENITLTEPLNYFDFIQLLKQSILVITDSGGLQEEAPSFGIPVMILRNKTERNEGIKSGAGLIIGTNASTIIQSVSQLLDDPTEYKSHSTYNNPYGDGKATSRIIGSLLGSHIEEFKHT
jgi:UDP-N-acetylglucosamine 2-epimerase (non-hydrolysing)